MQSIMNERVTFDAESRRTVATRVRLKKGSFYVFGESEKRENRGLKSTW